MNLSRAYLSSLAAAALLVLGAGCSDRDPANLKIARAPIDPLVFSDDYGADVYFQAFSGTFYAAVSLDSVYAQSGNRSLKITVPPQGSALGAYAGGVLTSGAARDGADFNALTFYARSSVNSVLNVAGFGNDNTGNSRFEAGRNSIPLSPDWKFIVIPIPSPAKLIAERGMFTFAESFEAQNPLGHEIWFDEIRFAKLGNIDSPVPVMPPVNKGYFVGATASLTGTYTIFKVDGANVRVDHMPGYFDFNITDPTVAAVKGGVIRIIGVGDAQITASLDGVDAFGTATVSGALPPPAPAAAPAPTAADVISLFSDSYRNVPVESWDANWGGSTADVADFSIAGNVSKMYSSLNFVGILFNSQTVDTSEMTHFHIDVFAPTGTNFRVKIIALDGDGGAVIEEKELTFNADSAPAFVAGEWQSLDIPLEDFGFTVDGHRDHIGMLALSTLDSRLVLVDNLYWHK